MRVRLNWGDDERHWSAEARPCRCCGQLTCRRDERGGPCHLACAEDEAAAQVASALFDSAVFDDGPRYPQFTTTVRETAG